MANKRIAIIASTALLGAMAIGFTALLLTLIVRSRLSSIFTFGFVVSGGTINFVVFILGTCLFAAIFILYFVLISHGHGKR